MFTRNLFSKICGTENIKHRIVCTDICCLIYTILPCLHLSFNSSRRFQLLHTYIINGNLGGGQTFRQSDSCLRRCSVETEICDLFVVYFSDSYTECAENQKVNMFIVYLSVSSLECA
jgi:hypothetical protein